MSEPVQAPVAFEVRDNTTGHIWRVWADGRTEGFPKGVMIMNRIPALMSKSRRRGSQEVERKLRAPTDAVLAAGNVAIDDPLGRNHAEPVFAIMVDEALAAQAGPGEIVHTLKQVVCVKG